MYITLSESGVTLPSLFCCDKSFDAYRAMRSKLGNLVECDVEEPPGLGGQEL